jgi:hypothetical protein
MDAPRLSEEPAANANAHVGGPATQAVPPAPFSDDLLNPRLFSSDSESNLALPESHSSTLPESHSSMPVPTPPIGGADFIFPDYAPPSYDPVSPLAVLANVASQAENAPHQPHAAVDNTLPVTRKKAATKKTSKAGRKRAKTSTAKPSKAQHAALTEATNADTMSGEAPSGRAQCTRKPIASKEVIPLTSEGLSLKRKRGKENIP